MKQQKIFLLVLVGLSITTVLWMRNSFLNRGQFDVPGASLPVQSTVNQQFAVETAPLPVQNEPVAAPVAAPLPETIQVAVAVPASPVAAPSEPVRPDNIMSYIQFVSHVDNYNVQSGEISWRAYREYRFSHAKSL